MDTKSEYPKYLFRPGGESVLVKDVAEHDALDGQWHETPVSHEQAEQVELQRLHDAEIARMLNDYPAYESVIEDARVSGSPLHLVAAKIADAETDRAAKDAEAAKAAKASEKAVKVAEKAALVEKSVGLDQLPLDGGGQ